MQTLKPCGSASLLPYFCSDVYLGTFKFVAAKDVDIKNIYAMVIISEF